MVFPIGNIEDVALKLVKEEGAIDKLSDSLFQLYLQRKGQYEPGIFEEYVTKRMLLVNLDRKWMDHLHNMDVLREGIGLRAWGQRDPLVEYKREGFDMFSELLQTVYEESLTMIYRAELVKQEEEEEERSEIQKAFPDHKMNYNRSENTKAPATTDKKDKVGRNDPCPCGSGKKYKKCCMK